MNPKIDLRTKKLVIFDLDGTLTPSKQVMEDNMIPVFMDLLSRTSIAVISGSGFPEFERRLLSKLPVDTAHFSKLYLLPASGTSLYVWRGNWHQQYAEVMTTQEKEKIMAAFKAAFIEIDYKQPEKTYGQIIEDRDSQITFSGLGQKAPPAEKDVWDKDRKKREELVSVIQPRIPEFDVRIGGTTSIDVTKKGVNKSYGIRKLEALLKLKTEDIVFVGDSLFHGGNDYPARATGVDCVQVQNPDHTRELISSWLAQ